MEKINKIIEEKIQKMKETHPDANWDVELINHGLGYMDIKKHDELVEKGLISCDGKEDTILCDAVGVHFEGKNEVTVEMDNPRDAMFEVEKAKKEGKKAKVVFWAKSYGEKMEREKAVDGFKSFEEEALDELAKLLD